MLLPVHQCGAGTQPRSYHYYLPLNICAYIRLKSIKRYLLIVHFKMELAFVYDLKSSFPGLYTLVPSLVFINRCSKSFGV